MLKSLWLLAAALLLGLGAVVPASEAGEEAEAKASDGVTVLVEVWRVSGEEMAKQIEVITDKSPTNDAAVRALITDSEHAKRACRFVTPTQYGKKMKHSDRAEKAITVSGPSGVGGRRGGMGFGGFSTAGSSISLVASELKGDRIGVDVAIKSTGQGESRKVVGGARIPPDKFTAEIGGSIAGASGTTRMFISQTTGADMVIVFVKATRI
jgi:hypothetical protein